MKILLTAEPEIPVPPQLYGGIERIIDLLVTKLRVNYPDSDRQWLEPLIPCEWRFR